MPESWAAQWAAQWADGARRFNQNHAPAGSATGGQFTTAGSGGGGSKAAAAHKAHVAHVQHVQHVAHVQHQAAQAASGARAQRKAALLRQAHADRVRAAQLQV
jgi:hypothetical protein